jgi:hypothetical protein
MDDTLCECGHYLEEHENGAGCLACSCSEFLEAP